MSAATLPRDPLMPRQPKGMGAGLGLALLAHALLLLAIAFGVNWRAHEPAGIEAELWSAVPQAAAPRAVAPEPQPPVQPQPQAPVKPPPPPVKAEEPPPKPAPDPQIAIEKAKREEQKKLEAKRQQEEEQAKREKAKREEQKREDAKRQAELEKQQQAKEDAERKKQAAAEAAKAAAARDAQLKRLQGLAGATGGDTSTGTALKSSGPSASYAGRIMARIKPNIVFTDVIDGNPAATVEVKLAPDGTIIGKRLLQSSGVKAWDDAVLRAIERTEMLPRDVDGRVPPPFPIIFRPRDVN